MDVLVGFVSRVPLPETYLPLMASTISSARSSGIKVIYVQVSFAPGFPEIPPTARPFYAAAKAGRFLQGSPEVEIHPSIAPVEGDIVVVKKRVSAFTGSSLEVILRSLGVGKLVLAGMSTSGVVLSTLCEAVDKDFEIVVLEDLCVDPNEEVHRVLIDHLFAKRGEVVGAKEWVEVVSYTGG